MNRYFDVNAPRRTPGMLGQAVWAQVTAEDGTWGLGRCTYGSPVAALIDDHLAALLVGRDCFATEMLNDLMWRSSIRHGITGLSGVAQSAIDLALWDLKGKLLGQPVYRLLGGPARDTMRCYVTCDDLDWATELGFGAYKISNPVYYEQGRPGLDAIEEKVASARAQVGESADLMFNAIMSFDARFAVDVADRLRPHRLRWLEEPLPVEDLDGHARLRNAAPWMTIATGEDHRTRISFHRLLERRAVDVIQPDLEWCGGLTEALKIAAIADVYGVEVNAHCGANSPFGQHFMAALPGSADAEFFLDSPVGVPLKEWTVIPGVPVPHDGYLTPSDSPGFGMEIDPAWIVPWQPTR